MINVPHTAIASTRIEILKRKEQALIDQLALTRTAWTHSAYKPVRAMYAYDLRFYGGQLEDVQWAIWEIEQGL